MATGKGSWLEEKLGELSLILVEKNIGILHKWNTPIKKIKERVFYSGQAPIDFIGMIYGKSIYIEAKSVLQNDKISFAQVRQEQHEWLDKVEKLGGLAFVCVGFREDTIRTSDTLYLVPYSTWKRLPHTVNAKSIRKDQLDRYSSILWDKEIGWYISAIDQILVS